VFVADNQMTWLPYHCHSHGYLFQQNFVNLNMAFGFASMILHTMAIGRTEKDKQSYIFESHNTQHKAIQRENI